MARVVQFPVKAPAKPGHRKARKRRRRDPEDFGQLNLFDQLAGQGKVVALPKGDSFFEQALVLDEQGDKDAERYYLLAIENHQSVDDAWCNLGILKSGQGELAKAIDCLTRCLQRDPRHFEAHYNLGNVYSDLGNLELAKAHYELSTETGPAFPNSFYNLGLVLISFKKYREALRYIQKYVELSPGTDHDIANELIKTLNTMLDDERKNPHSQ